MKGSGSLLEEKETQELSRLREPTVGRRPPAGQQGPSSDTGSACTLIVDSASRLQRKHVCSSGRPVCVL